MTLLHKLPKELRPIVEEAIGRGCWTMEYRPKAGHRYRMRHASGQFVVLHSTKIGSSGRALLNLRADIRRIEKQGL